MLAAVTGFIASCFCKTTNADSPVRTVSEWPPVKPGMVRRTFEIDMPEHLAGESMDSGVHPGYCRTPAARIVWALAGRYRGMPFIARDVSGDGDSGTYGVKLGTPENNSGWDAIYRRSPEGEKQLAAAAEKYGTGFDSPCC